MGMLQQQGLRRTTVLSARTLLGRSSRCDLHISHPSVSGEHAVVCWDGESWTIRDLASSNGTLVNGERLAPHEHRVLKPEDRLHFGLYPVAWTVESVDAPVARALRVRGNGTVVMQEGMIPLPSANAPLAMIYTDPTQGWMLESLNEIRRVRDLEVVEIDGEAWRLHLPVEQARTVGGVPAVDSLADVALEFEVSADEEHVSLVAMVGLRQVSLGSRSHHYALLTLARQRLQDAEQPDMPESEHGWMYHESLMRMLRLSRGQLNLLVFRARKQLAELDIRDAQNLVERRPDSRQLRIGIDRLTVQRA